MTKQEVQEKIKEVETAIKVVCFLYPKANGLDKPHAAGVVLRRLFLRKEDLYGFLEIADET